VDYFSIIYYIRLRKNMSITASIVYSKLDYCNYLHYSLPKSEIHHRTDSEIFFTSIHTVVKAPKSSNITPILRSLHWPKINAFLSLTSRTSQPDYLYNNLISVQSTCRTHSFSAIILSRSPPSGLISFSGLTSRILTCT